MHPEAPIGTVCLTSFDPYCQCSVRAIAVILVRLHSSTDVFAVSFAYLLMKLCIPGLVPKGGKGRPSTKEGTTNI